MRNVKVFGLAVVALGLLGGGAFRAADKEKEDAPKYTIKQVMSQAHRKSDKNKPTLAEKVINGKADKDEQAKLLELYTAISTAKPPKGDPDAWKEKVSAITTAIQGVIDGTEGADKDLNKATNCRNCHTSHRGR